MDLTEARWIVSQAGDLYERGEMSFATYDRMRTALVNQHYAMIAADWEMFGPKGSKRERTAELETEVTALRERQAAAEQREQQARAIIEPVAAAGVDSDDDSSSYLCLDGAYEADRVLELARAWLAAMPMAEPAEQRAAEAEGEVYDPARHIHYGVPGVSGGYTRKPKTEQERPADDEWTFSQW